jgi:hypothetical protein
MSLFLSVLIFKKRVGREDVWPAILNTARYWDRVPYVVRSEVLTAVNTKFTIFWYVTTCTSVDRNVLEELVSSILTAAEIE